MRLRNVKNALDILNDSKYFIKDNYQGKWSSLFKNNNPIALEIGCGKGDYLINMAKNFPNINFIGIEKYSSVASMAIKKIGEEKLENLKIIISDVMNLEELLKNKVSLIYLNGYSKLFFLILFFKNNYFNFFSLSTNELKNLRK